MTCYIKTIFHLLISRVMKSVCDVNTRILFYHLQIIILIRLFLLASYNMDTAEYWNIHFENEYTEHRRPAEDLRTMDTKCCIYVGQCEGTYKCIKLELQPWQAQIISCPTITSSQSPTAFPFYTYATIFAPTLYFFLSFFLSLFSLQ